MSMSNQNASHIISEHETVIEARGGWFAIDFREIWHYRDLVFLFVQKEFIARYRQTILGPLWFVIQPLLLTGVFTFIFGRIGGVSTDGFPPALFYLCGLVTWGYFVQSFEGVAHALAGNAYIFRKVYFPRLVIPLSVVVSKLLVFVTQLAVFLVAFAYYKFFTPAGAQIHPNLTWLALTPVLLLLAIVLSLGTGLWFAALTVKYRDFSHVTGFIIQLWFYGTPILYPASRIPKDLFFIYQLNPMALVVDGYRQAFLGQGVISLGSLACTSAFTLFIFITGLLLFNRIEKNCVDVI